MIKLTEKATDKVKEVLGQQEESFTGIRLSVIGGGCSGFQYTMNLERQGGGTGSGPEARRLPGFCR